ncbi:unnamed protein product [Closterium sp. NIES-54]
MVTTTTPGGQLVSICTCTWTGRHLATFTRRPRSSLYTLAIEPPQVAASTQVSVLGQVAASCSCHLLSHQTLLWHHRLGHPSLPHLRGMHSRLLVSGLPRSLPPLPPSPASPCLPCVEGRQRAAPHSSSFPPTTAPLQTLHMDVKGEVVDVLIPWIRTVRLQLRERFCHDLPVLRLHSDRGGELSSHLLRDFCRGEGILQSFTLPDSPQQNGIAERRIGLVMDGAGGASPGGAGAGDPGTKGASSRGAGDGGAGAGGASPGGAGARGPGTGGASSGGAGAGGAGTGGASSGGVGVGGPGIGGARTGGAGAGDLDPGGTPSGDTGTGGASSEETGAGDTMSAERTPPPHRHDTRYQAAYRRAREEQERLERERQELRQLDLLEQQQHPP